MGSVRGLPLRMCRAALLAVLLALVSPDAASADRIVPTVNGTLSQQHVGLGGISPGMTSEDVIRVWGAPEGEESAGYGNTVYSYMGGSFVVTFRHGWLRTISCSAADGLAPEELPATPNGVAPGLEAGILNENYGTATQTELLPDGHTVYAYWGMGTALYQYLFFYTKDGIIDRIICGMGD